MRFATVTQIVIMAVVSCAALFSLDYWKNPQLWHTQRVSAAESANKGPWLTLGMNHLVCTTCLDDVREALKTTPGLDMANARIPKNLPTQAEAEKMAPQADYSNTIEVPIVDLQKVDFAAVDKALREKGFIAGRMEIGGVEHFRLEATLPHLCCGVCQRATTEHIEFLKAKGSGGQFRWLDSLNVDRDHKMVTAYARYLAPGKTVDVDEFIAGLNDTGFAPLSVHAVVGDEKMKPAAANDNPHEAEDAHSHNDSHVHDQVR